MASSTSHSAKGLTAPVSYRDLDRYAGRSPRNRPSFQAPHGRPPMGHGPSPTQAMGRAPTGRPPRRLGFADRSRAPPQGRRTHRDDTGATRTADAAAAGFFGGGRRTA